MSEEQQARPEPSEAAEAPPAAPEQAGAAGADEGAKQVEALGEQLGELEVDDAQDGQAVVGAADLEEDPEMELTEADMEEVVFDEDNPPSEDEEDDDEVDLAEEEVAGEDDEDEDDNGGAAPIQQQPDGAAAVFEGHSDSVYCVALNSDGSKAISGGGDDVAYLWDPASGAKLARLEGHTDSVVDCGFSVDGSLAATAAYDSTVKIWDTGTGELKQSLEGPSSEIEFLAWHPKGNVVMAGSEDATCWVWDATTGHCLSVLAGHEAPLTCGQFTPNGKRVVTGSLDGTVRLWDPRSSSCVHSFTGHDWHQAGVVSLACRQDQALLAAGGQDGTIRLALLETKKVIGRLLHDPKAAEAQADLVQADGEGATCSVEAVALSLDNPFLASGGTDNRMRVFDLNTQTCRQVCAHDDTVIAVHFVPSSPLLVSASSDGTARLWDSRSGDMVRLLTSHADMVLGLASRGSVVATCSDDQVCRVASLGDLASLAK